MKKSFEPSELLGPLPVVMITCGDKKESNIITVAWTGIINSAPPMTYVSVRKSRYSHEIIKRTGEFVINLINENLAEATDRCGVKSGRDFDKFAETGLHKSEGEIVKCPLITESPVNIECKVTEIKELGSHDMFMAEIVKVHVNEELIDENGKFDFGNAKMVAYLHGEYFGLKGKPLGRFGFSVMKPKTKKRISKEEHEKRVSKNKEKKNSRNREKRK